MKVTVKDYGKANGYKFIIGANESTGNILYGDEAADLSDLMSDYYASDSQQDIVKYINTAYQKLKVICPNCQNSMLQVHYDFEVPAQRDNKSWKLIQKRMFPKTVLDYRTYIQWHRLELQKAEKNTTRFKVLKQNLGKLIKQ